MDKFGTFLVYFMKEAFDFETLQNNEINYDKKGNSRFWSQAKEML